MFRFAEVMVENRENRSQELESSDTMKEYENQRDSSVKHCETRERERERVWREKERQIELRN